MKTDRMFIVTALAVIALAGGALSAHADSCSQHDLDYQAGITLAPVAPLPAARLLINSAENGINCSLGISTPVEEAPAPDPSPAPTSEDYSWSDDDSD